MSISIKTNFATNAEIEKMFGTVDTMQRYKVGDRVVTAGSSVVLKRAKQLTPRDKDHGRKRSKNQLNKLTKSGEKINWDIPLWKTMSRKVKRTERGAYAIIGPTWPDGNKAYFNTGPHGRRVFYWGKDQQRTQLQVRNWIVQAADETRSEQLSAMEAKMKEAIDEVMRG